MAASAARRSGRADNGWTVENLGATTGDWAVTGDWNGDGITDIGIVEVDLSDCLSKPQ